MTNSLCKYAGSKIYYIQMEYSECAGISQPFNGHQLDSLISTKAINCKLHIYMVQYGQTHIHIHHHHQCRTNWNNEWLKMEMARQRQIMPFTCFWIIVRSAQPRFPFNWKPTPEACENSTFIVWKIHCSSLALPLMVSKGN